VTGSVTVRPGRPDDTGAMLALTRDVWGGHDYVPLVWRQWLSDTGGALFMAELDGKIVGLQHASVQPDNTAWLEGIRVDERAQGRGIGTVMLTEAIAWARNKGLGAVRLSTASGNPSSNRIAEKAGFTVVERFTPIRAVPASEAGAFVRVALASDLEEVWSLIGRTQYYTEGWTAYGLTRDRLRVLLGRGCVALWGKGAGRAVGIATATMAPNLRMGLLVGDSAGMAAVCGWLRARAAESGFELVRAALPVGSEGLQVAIASGFTASAETWEHAMLLHELRLRL
jgi:GNAT superfamily N-acetyltransferase